MFTSLCGNAKGKDTAIGNVVTQGQCSAVSRQDRSAEGQAQSKAAVAVCDAALPGIKHLEHLCFCAIRNAGTVICNVHYDLMVFPVSRNLNDRATGCI